MTRGKEKTYLLYDESSEELPESLSGAEDVDDVLATLDSTGIEVLEEPQLDDKIEFDRKIEEFSEDLGELELPASMERPTTRCVCTCARWGRFRCSPARAK